MNILHLVLPVRARRSLSDQSTAKPNSSTWNVSVMSNLIRQEVSKQLQHLLKTQVCIGNKRQCVRGPPGRRGPRGKKGKPGPQGKTGPTGPIGPRGKTFNHLLTR